MSAVAERLVNLEEYVQRTVAAAPPLTDEQRTKLAAILTASTAAPCPATRGQDAS